MAVALPLRMSKSILFAAITFFAVAACACGSSSTPSSPSSTPGPDVTVNITGINGSQSFAPSPTTIKVGQRVIWKNTDPAKSHDAAADAGSFTTPVLASGASSDPITMNTAGTFTYHCSIHPSMVGTITVQ